MRQIIKDYSKKLFIFLLKYVFDVVDGMCGFLWQRCAV